MEIGKNHQRQGPNLPTVKKIKELAEYRELFSLRNAAGESVVRTILGVNEAEHSLTFAGDLPQGGQSA